MSHSVMGRLLEHEDPQVAVEAAHGEWRADPRQMVRASVRDAWSRVIVNHTRNDYWLPQVFQADPELALEWLLARMAEDTSEHSIEALFPKSEDASAHQAAVQVQDSQTRTSLLAALAKLVTGHRGHEYIQSRWVMFLVGDESAQYEQLLSEPKLEKYHLVPLRRRPDEVWMTFSRLAFASNYSPRDVLKATLAIPPEALWRSPSDVFSKWVEDFERLLSSDSEEIRKVGQLWLAWAEANRDR